MPVHNADIARVFDEIADLLELESGNPFRVRAYRNAARLVGGLRLDIAAQLAEGKALPKLPGIGDDLSAKMREIAASGTCKLREQLRKRAPAGITELLRIPGLGPKKVQALYRELDVHTPQQLHRAARDGRLREPARVRREEGEEAARGGAGASRQGAALQAGARGAVRRAAGRAPARGARRGAGGGRGQLPPHAGDRRRPRHPGHRATTPRTRCGASPATAKCSEVLASGGTRASVVLASGIQVDLRVVPAESFGAALHYFTGSKAHNIAIRKLGQARGLKINEYGVFRGKRRVAGETEASVYAAVGLPEIAPELREDQGEIEAARRGTLPRLVERSDLKGDLHAHTKASDGHNTLREMAEAARARGLRYLAITEHSRRVTMAHGLDPQRLAQQIDQIERLNRELRGVTLLKGIEVDILEDGALDLPDSILAQLDVVIGAVHSKFDLSRARQTERLLAAMERPQPVDPRASDRAPDRRARGLRRRHAGGDPQGARQGRILELNAHPERLDLSDVHCRMAKDEGVLVSINSDAHDTTASTTSLRRGPGAARLAGEEGRAQRAPAGAAQEAAWRRSTSSASALSAALTSTR